MYQFTKETIINSNLDSNGVSTKFITDGSTFSVLRSGNFPKANVTSCIKIPYVAPVKAALTKTVSTANSNTAKIYRLYVKLKRIGSFTSDYANAMTRNFLEKFYEVAGVSGGTASTLVASFETAINKENNFKDNVYFTVSKSGAAITLTAIDEYTHFEKVEIHEVLASSASLTGYDSFTVLEDVLGGGSLTAGTEGFGTVKQITKNLRLPTLANTSWLALGQDERPVPGGQYTCYILKLKTVDAEQGGVSTIGQEITSVTTHKFYVLSTLITAFEAAINGSGINIDTMGTAVTAVSITSGNLDISDVVGGAPYQVTYTTTPSGVTGATFALNAAASTVAGTADWTKVTVSNAGLISLVTGHGLANADKVAINVTIDGYTVTKEITLAT
jgi:hypothetical protein